MTTQEIDSLFGDEQTELANTEEVENLDENTAIVTQQSAVSGSPLDLPTKVFEASLERRGQNRDILIHWIRGSLVEDVDYGSIVIGGRKSRPSLFKTGAQKIVGKLGVVATFPNLYKYEDAVLDGKLINQIILKCELVNPNGEAVATGVGARIVEEDRGDLNKALKMAKKSALIDATLDLGGLSEVFTQDIEDMNLADKKYDGTKDPDAKYPVERSNSKGAGDFSNEWSKESRHQEIKFGKHKGVKYSEVEESYLDWLYGATQDPDSKWADWMQPFLMAELDFRRNGEKEEQPVGNSDTEKTWENESKEKQKDYPDDYSDEELIALIGGKLKTKYVAKYSEQDWDTMVSSKMGTGKMSEHPRDNLLKLIDETADLL